MADFRRLSTGIHQGVRRAGILAYALPRFILSVLLRGQRVGSLSDQIAYSHGLRSIGSIIHTKDLNGTVVSKGNTCVTLTSDNIRSEMHN